MPRKRERTTEKGTWSEEVLKKAIETINNGGSIRKTAKEYQIPFSTLQERVKKNQLTAPRLGRKAVFTIEQEQQIASNIVSLANVFYGLPPLRLRELVFEFAEKLEIKHPFNKQKHAAGKDWLEGFLKRNTTISVRKPEATSINRIKGFNKDEVGKFFENLETLMGRYKFSPTQIWNVDESGITTVQETGKIMAPKGQKRVGSVTSGERGCTTTVICCMSAQGSYVPPMFISARQRMAPTLEINGPTGSKYSCSKNGWTTEELYVEWLHHFKQHVKPTNEESQLLILDNHGSHISLESYEFCRKNNIHVLSLPPHSSHRLQPLDVFFGPLKKAYSKECDLFLKSNPGKRITIYNVAELFNRTYSNVATIAKGVSGFATTGISPINPNVFGDEDFAATATDESRTYEPTTGPSGSYASGPSMSAATISFEDISLVPHIGSQNNQTIFFFFLWLARLSEKITFSNFNSHTSEKRNGGKKRKMEERKNKSNQLVIRSIDYGIKKSKKKANPTKEEEEESDDDGRGFEDDGDNEQDRLEDDFKEIEEDNNFVEIISKEIEDAKIGDWIVAKFISRKSVKMYVGQLTCVKPCLEAKFARRVLPTSTFRWPIVEDKTLIRENEIFMFLPEPFFDKRGKFTFNMSFNSYNIS